MLGISPLSIHYHIEPFFAGGFLGAAFVAVNHVITKFRIRYLKRLKAAQVVEVAVVSMVSATVAFSLMYLSSVCRPLGQDENVQLQVGTGCE